jgi:hypothetical protein
MKKRTASYSVVSIVISSLTLLSGEPANPGGEPQVNATSVESKPSQTAEPIAAPIEQTQPKKASQPAKLSFGVDEVVKMHQSGVEPDVVLNYVENSNVPYHLSAEEIVRLHDLGVPSPIITALIRHGAKVQQEAVAAYAQSQQKAVEAARAASASATAYAAPVYTPPPATVTYNYAYPEYAYAGYPTYYSYPGYCYSSPFYFSFSYPGYRHFYSYGGFRGYPRFGFGGHYGFGGHIGPGHVGFGGGFHGGGRHH